VTEARFSCPADQEAGLEMVRDIFKSPVSKHTSRVRSRMGVQAFHPLLNVVIVILRGYLTCSVTISQGLVEMQNVRFHPGVTESKAAF
jgi:hypothetical protein